jgi:hypothetical protein
LTSISWLRVMVFLGRTADGTPGEGAGAEG